MRSQAILVLAIGNSDASCNAKEAYAEAQKQGLDIHFELKGESWQQTHFMVSDVRAFLKAAGFDVIETTSGESMSNGTFFCTSGITTNAEGK